MTPPTPKPGWKTVKFGDLVHLNTERVADPAAEGIERYVGLEHITPEDLRIRSWGLVAEGTTFTNFFKPGQVLFGKRRAYQRKVAVADFEGVCSGDIYVLEPKDPNVLLPELLPFICQTEGFYEHAVSTSAGSLSPRTNWNQLAKYEFPLPPLDEQRRIISTLKLLEKTIDETKDLLLYNEKLFKSAQTTLHLGKNHSGVKKTTPLGEVPDEWKVIPLRKLGDFSNGVSKPASAFGSGTPFVNLQDIFGKIILSSMPEGRVQVNERELDSHRLNKGDILFVRSSVKRSGVGITVLIDTDWNGNDVLYAGFIIRFRLFTDIVLPRYANYYFHEANFRRQLISRSTESLNTNINQQQLGKLPCIIPPQPVQKETIDVLDSIIAGISSIQTKIHKTNDLKKLFLNEILT